MGEALRQVLILLVMISLGYPSAFALSAQPESLSALGVMRVTTLNGVLSNPIDSDVESTNTVIGLIQESLVDWRQSEADGTPMLVGELAETFSPLEEQGLQNTYVFNLRPGTKWHDGIAFSAQDVVFTFDAVRNSDIGSPYKTQLDAALAHPAKGIETCVQSTGATSTPSDVKTTNYCPYYARDEDTLVIYSSGIPEEDFLRALIIPIIPRHIWMGVEANFKAWMDDAGSTGVAAERVIGTGQYRFISRTQYVRDCDADYDPNQPLSIPDEDMRLEINPEFSSSTPAWPAYPEIIIKVYACSHGTITQGDRIGRAVSNGTVNINSFMDLRVTDLVLAQDFLDSGKQPEIDIPRIDVGEADPQIIEKAHKDISSINFDASGR